jgi:hypothetical protein
VPLGFSCNVLVLGLEAVGKTALINEMVGYRLTPAGGGVGPSGRGRTEDPPLEWLHGEVNGVQMYFLEAPGLSKAARDSRRNARALRRVRAALSGRPPDIVLFVDRLDAGQAMDTGRMAKQACSVLGRGFWARLVVVLTHASALPFDEESGEASEFDAVRGWRAHSTLSVLRHAALNPVLSCPVQTVELHPGAEVSASGEKLLVDGTPWRPPLLMQCFLARVFREFSAELQALGALPPSASGGSAMGDSLRSSWSSLGGSSPRGEGSPLRGSVPLDRGRLARALGFMPLGHLVTWLLQPRRALAAPSGAQEGPLVPGKAGLEQEREGEADFPWVAAHPAFPFSLAQEAPTPDMSIPAPDPSMLPRFDCDSGAHSYRYRYLENLRNPWVSRAVVDTDWFDGQDGVNGFTSEGILELSRGALSAPARVTAHLTMPGGEVEAASGHAELTLRSGDAGGCSLLADVEAQHLGQGAAASARVEAHAPMTRRSRLVLGASAHRCGTLARPLADSAAGLRLGQILDLPGAQEAEVGLAVVRPSQAAAAGAGLAAASSITGFTVRYQRAPQAGEDAGPTCRASCSAIRHGGQRHVFGDLEVSGRLGGGLAATARAQKGPRGPALLGLKLSSQEDLRPGLAGAGLVAAALLGERLGRKP